jgi:hypothetical protein
MNEVGEHKRNQHQHIGDPLVNRCACVDKLFRGLAYCDSKENHRNWEHKDKIGCTNH